MISPEEPRPTCDEAAIARLSYLNWERSRAEGLSEYVYRRRAVDLSFLTAEVVKSELTDNERNVIELVYYRRKKLSDAAKDMDRDKSTVKRTLQRAEEKIQHHLKYAISYQYNLKTVSFLPVAVREALAVAAWRLYSPETFGERLRKLRLSENIGMETLADALALPESRLEALESGQESPTAPETVALAAFFGRTTDYLLTGERGGSYDV
ncbi:MAG: helix-turn-helix domain-containing protein [Oscillospiraceae bacterium]|nr:helix-turn-helix domain-containing protein [Oscillospiraceae bacterium]